jgi:Spy/CpxP family protein refolding chaperone
MKAFRIAALSAVLLIGVAAMAKAQAQQGGQMGGRRNSMQMNGIELTDAQKVKREEIQKKYEPEMVTLRDQMMNGGDRTELRKKFMALQDKAGAEIRAILTPDQQVVWDKNMAELKARVEQAQRQAPPGN